MSESRRSHELKCWPASFQAILSGGKRVEIRFDDRGYRVGDDLRLSEWEPISGRYTGRKQVVEVTHVLNLSDVPVPRGYRRLSLDFVALSIDVKQTAGGYA